VRTFDTRGNARPLTLALLAAGLASLFAGRFIQFDDSSGFGSDRWVRPWGYLAVLLAVGSLVIALTRKEARRSLGLALALLDFVLISLTLADDGFRFIWHAGEGELTLLELALGLASAFLLIPHWVASKHGGAADGTRFPSPWARAAIYAGLTVVILFAAYYSGTAHYEASQCSAPYGECDLAGLEGVVWAGAAFVAIAIAVGMAEATLAVLRRGRRGRGRDPGEPRVRR
jgi:hypothetical protein